MANGKIDLLCQYIENSKAKNYPIKNDCLRESTDFIKNGYLKMLAVILQQAGETTDAQVNIYKRILAGAQSELTAEDFLRMALSVEIEDFVNFTGECKELTLKYNFVLDAIILIGVKEKKEEQIRLLVGFCEALGITKEEIRYLAAMAKAILETSESAYADAYEVKADSIPDMVFQGYMYLIAKSCICANDNWIIFQPSCAEEVEFHILEKIRESNVQNIKFVNVEIELQEFFLYFSGKSRVIFESCVFKEGNKHSITFENCEKVEFVNTKFVDFDEKVICIDEVNTIRIKECTFENCRKEYSSLWTARDKQIPPGVIYSPYPRTNGRVTIEKTYFENCGGICHDRFEGVAFISNISCKVDSCSFINCGYWEWREYPLDRANFDSCLDIRLFPDRSEAINCVYENSARFS